MRVTINELMDQMGVGFVPGPYDSVPFSHYDADKGVTCSAEVRMGMDGDEVDAEIQMLYDTPPEGKGAMEQICVMRAKPLHDSVWSVTSFSIRNAPYGKDIYDWESKACLFFSLIVQDLKAGKLPAIEDLLDEAFYQRDRFKDQRGSGSSKAPKIKPGKMLNLKGGRGF